MFQFFPSLSPSLLTILTHDFHPDQTTPAGMFLSVIAAYQKNNKVWRIALQIPSSQITCGHIADRLLSSLTDSIPGIIKKIHAAKRRCKGQRNGNSL